MNTFGLIFKKSMFILAASLFTGSRLSGSIVTNGNEIGIMVDGNFIPFPSQEHGYQPILLPFDPITIGYEKDSAYTLPMQAHLAEVSGVGQNLGGQGQG